MKFAKVFTVCLLIVVASGSLVWAQNSIQRERTLLMKNIELYKTGRYEKADQNFSLIVSRLPGSKFITTNHLMLTRTKYKMGDYNGALDLCRNFLDTYFGSKYEDDILYTMGNCYFRLNRFETAVRSWLRSINICRDNKLAEQLGSLVTRTVRYKLDSGQVRRLRNEGLSSDTEMLLAIAKIEDELEQGRGLSSQSQLTALLNSNPRGKYAARARNLLETGKISDINSIRFALLLPLSGPNKDIGNEIKEGVDFAVEEFNQKSDRTVNIVIEDYGQEVINAVRSYKQLAQNKSVLAVLGPLENDITAACAALSDYESLPIISPTATDPGLTELTDNFFQLNPNITLRSEFLAKYATDSLKLKRFVTFSPLDNHFIKMVDTFVETVSLSGAEIVSQEWYYPGDQDFFKQFMKIKRIGLKYEFRDSIWTESPLLDTLIVDSMYAAYMEEEREKNEESNTKIDSADIPVTTIDGVFIPIYKEDLQYMAPQIAYSNIQAQYMGNGDWYDLDGLKKNKNYINGIVFVSDGFINEQSWDYRNFRNEYRTKLNKTPSFYNILGYDGIRFMLSALQSEGGNIFTRDQFIGQLKNLKNFDGILRKIRLDTDGRNSSLQLLKYEYGEIIPLN